MQVVNPHASAEISGLQASSFGFEMNAKMYDILISKMYTNKPGAVIRELSANAWDAHVEAGNSDKPFDMQLPTWLDKTFRIRDYGTGIPHNKFEQIYTNVGASTKEGTNTLIGGFGLGSKAPFTMTDTFMVENFHEGLKTTWVCFKDKGVPQVSKVSTEATDEPNGLCVSFTFDSSEVTEFTRQVMTQLRYFPVKPNITGGEGPIMFPPLPDNWDTKDYFFTAKADDYYNRKDAYVVMGNVCYNLNVSRFDYKYRDIFRQGIIIKMPIGSVDIPPSRENLEMTERTIKAISDVLDRILKDYEDEVKQSVAQVTSEFELRKLLLDVNSDLLPRDFWDNEYNGRSFRVLRNNSYKTLGDCEMFEVVERRSKKRYVSAYVGLRSLVDDLCVFYVNDLGKGSRSFIADSDVTDYDASGNPTGKRTIILQPDHYLVKDKATVIQNIVNKMKEQIGKEPLLLSTLIGQLPKKPKGTNKPRVEPQQVFLLNTATTDRSKLLSEAIEQQDLPSTGYYIRLHGNKLITTINNLGDYWVKGLHEFLDGPVYLVRTKTIPKVTGLKELSNTHVLNCKKAIVDKAVETYRWDSVLNYFHVVPKEFLPYLRNVKDPSLKAYIRCCKYVVNKNSARSCKYVDLAKTLDHNALYVVGAYNPSPKVIKAKEKYQEVHELLCHITSSYSEERNKKRLTAFNLLIN